MGLFVVPALAQEGGLAGLEKRAAEQLADKSWSPAKAQKGAAINADLIKLLDSDALKTGEEFRRAAAVVQWVQGSFQEQRMRHELTFTAMALGDAEAAKQIKGSWDQFLIASGRLQHLGFQKAYEGMQADKYAVQPAPTCVQTVLDDPIKARKTVVTMKSNPELHKLVEEDQKVRQDDWSKLTQAQIMEISRADDKRRAQLKSLLKDIKIMTAQDYQDAALVMQHGSWFDDYALAHELSLCSTILDPKIGRQMVALSYDRMLVSAGYLQRVATQYQVLGLTPVESSGFNDTMRKALGRKPLAEVPKTFGG